MFRCSECGSKLNILNPVQGVIFCCPECDIEMEFYGNYLTTLHLGPSEE
jgi:hypothetical protein